PAPLRRRRARRPRPSPSAHAGRDDAGIHVPTRRSGGPVMTEIGLLVIGSGPAGHTAAGAYREAGGEGAVVLLSAEGRLPYERPPLSKDLLRGESEPDDTRIEDAPWYAERDIVLRAGTAVALDADARAVALADGA